MKETTTNTQNDTYGFAAVDQMKDPALLFQFLDARRSIPSDVLIKRQIRDRLQPLENQRVLDVGCGTGDDTREIAALVGAAGYVIGVDSSARMIHEAKRRTDSDLPLEFRMGSVMKLEFPDGYFDCARAERVFMHLDDPHRGLSEVIRVVRSGGRIVVSELDRETRFIDSPYTHVTRKILTSLADRSAGGRVGKTLRRVFQQSGLAKVELQATVTHPPHDLFRVSLESHVNQCVEEGLISQDDATQWWQQLAEASASGVFFGGIIAFTVSGVKQ
jgi:ubiquinone/menaquinone biosynthesis C-methylase UbiE